MKSWFKNLWFKISHVGVFQQTQSSELIRIILLTNQFTFISIVGLILGGVQNFLNGNYIESLIVECSSFVLISVFLLNERGSYRTARFILFMSLNLLVFLFSSFWGSESGLYLHYFPIILAIAFMFSGTNRISMITYLAMTLFFITILLLTDFSLFKDFDITQEELKSLFSYNIASSSVELAFFMNVINSINIKQRETYELRIQERNFAEGKIKSALKEKEILLAEVHHRVKNNLAVITSLVNIQMHGIQEPDTREILNEIRNRVMSMSLIHNKLYHTNTLSDIDFSDYIKDLVAEIQSSYPDSSADIDVEIEALPVHMDVTHAIPCGLILNEVLSNIYKHAFKGRNEGIIKIDFLKENEKFILRVKDNGVGFEPKEISPDYVSLGMTIIESLTEQLDGKSSFVKDNGTLFTLSF